MLKFLSELKDLKILLFQERAVVSVVKDYLISAETGKLLGIYTIHPLEKAVKIIPSSHIKAIGNDFVLIDSLDSLTEPEEIVKVKEAQLVDPKILGEAVFTEGGFKVGKVKDAVISFESLKLEKLYLNPTGVTSFARELIIPANKIVKIEKKKIIIKDGAQKIRSSVFAPKPTPVIN